MENSLPFFLNEEDEEESNLLWRKQAIELQSEDGTHKLELPVSRTTLNVWGGVPSWISEKSNKSQNQHQKKSS